MKFLLKWKDSNTNVLHGCVPWGGIWNAHYKVMAGFANLTTTKPRAPHPSLPPRPLQPATCINLFENETHQYHLALGKVFPSHPSLTLFSHIFSPILHFSLTAQFCFPLVCSCRTFRLLFSLLGTVIVNQGKAWAEKTCAQFPRLYKVLCWAKSYPPPSRNHLCDACCILVSPPTYAGAWRSLCGCIFIELLWLQWKEQWQSQELSSQERDIYEC